MIFESDFNVTEEQKEKYIQTVKIANNNSLDDIDLIRLEQNGEKHVKIHYKKYNEPKFERIRRITGYLTGTIDRWNNAKKAEEKERVKHG